MTVMTPKCDKIEEYYIKKITKCDWTLDNDNKHDAKQQRSRQKSQKLYDKLQ